MPPKCAVLAAVLLLAACSGDDGDDDATPTTPPSGGCPLAAAVVAEAVAHAVEVERTGTGTACAYVGVGDAAGSRVEVSLRSLADEPYADVLAAVEGRAGPTIAADVDGADRAWLVRVGRSVQVGAATGDVLAVVAVVDALLDADAAQEVAIDLAGEALSG